MRLRRFLARVAASRWTKPAVRIALFVAGLLMLAVIGRASAGSATLDGPHAPSSASATSPLPATATDAGAASASTAVGLSTHSSPIAAAGAAAASDSPTTTTPAARASADNPVFLNDAREEDLRRLPGIGPKRAQAILDLRTRMGRFHRVEDLLRVKGIGRATLQHLRPLVRVERAPP